MSRLTDLLETKEELEKEIKFEMEQEAVHARNHVKAVCHECKGTGARSYQRATELVCSLCAGGGYIWVRKFSGCTQPHDMVGDQRV